MITEPGYATRSEASAYLHLSLDQLKGLAKDGLLTMVYINCRTIRIPWAEVRTVMDRKRALEKANKASQFSAHAKISKEILDLARQFFGNNIPGLPKGVIQ